MDFLDQAIAKFNQGGLAETIELCNEGLRNKPKDIDLRVFLSQVLTFAGNWDRIDKICDQIMGQSKESRNTFFFGSVAKKLVEGERLRELFWKQGQLPELMTEKDEVLTNHFKACAEDLASHAESAQQLIDESNEKNPVMASCNGSEPAEFRDLNPLTSQVFELLLPTGGYTWLPMNAVRRITFSEISRPMDQCWRQANIVLKNENTFFGYLPCVYFESSQSEDEEFQMGRKTDWVESEGRLDKALGRRIFSVGSEREMCAMEISEITIKD